MPLIPAAAVILPLFLVGVAARVKFKLRYAAAARARAWEMLI